MDGLSLSSFHRRVPAPIDAERVLEAFGGDFVEQYEELNQVQVEELRLVEGSDANLEVTLADRVEGTVDPARQGLRELLGLQHRRQQGGAGELRIEVYMIAAACRFSAASGSNPGSGSSPPGRD